jgi:ABC-type branched-subunit amino acid transport system ATPase component/ABC-type branched-subunit amino acid transport system permease subunit
MSALTITVPIPHRDQVVRGTRAVIVVLAVAVAPMLLGRAAPGLLSDARASTLGKGACFAVAALSLNLLMGYAGQISLGQFAFVGVGAFSAGWVLSPYHWGVPYLVAVPVAAAMGAAIATVVGLPALRLRGVYLAIATIGFSYAMESCVFKIKSITGSSSGMQVWRPIAGSFVFQRDADLLALLVLLLGLVWLVDRNVTSGKVGRAFRAIKASESVAAAYGIDVARYKLLAFAVSGAMAGVAGAMYGPLVGTVSSASFTYTLSLFLVIIVVVGGLGSRVGVVVSAFAFVTLPGLLVAWFGDGIRGWDQVIGAALLIFTVARHPGGFAEAMRERREKRATRAAQPVYPTEPAAGDGAQEQPRLPRLPHLPRPTGLPPRPDLPDGVPLLAVRHVSVRFGGLQAVDSASFDVLRGRIVGLIGPNGAGKSTLFNAVSGLVRPEQGSVHFLGQDISHLPPHRRAALGIGRTFQQIGLAKDLSVLENLLLAQHTVATYSTAAALTGLGGMPLTEWELRQRAREAIAALGFEAFRDLPVALLSHGQQRIVEIGCTLVTAPELVMLDEPSAGMSPGAAENLAERLRDIRDELGRTVLLIEHNIPLVLDVCDEVYVLAAGRVIASGSPQDVVSRPDVVSAYLGEEVAV